MKNPILHRLFISSMIRMEAYAQQLIDSPYADDKDIVADLELVKLIARYNIDNKEEAGLSSFFATLCTVYLAKPKLWGPLQEAIVRYITKQLLSDMLNKGE